MSKLMLYSVYDKVAKIYQPPVYCHNQVHAMRHFTEVLHNNDFLQRHAGDYSVFEVAEFDDENGKVAEYTEKQHIFEMSDLEVNVSEED